MDVTISLIIHQYAQNLIVKIHEIYFTTASRMLKNIGFDSWIALNWHQFPNLSFNQP